MGEMQQSEPSTYGRIASLRKYVVLEIFPNAHMVPPPQTRPNHIQPIDFRYIKPKTFSTNGIGGVFLFQKDTPHTLSQYVVIHKIPGQQKSWDPHGLEGWYRGPSMEHYICRTVYINKNRTERIVDTMEFPLISIKCQ